MSGRPRRLVVVAGTGTEVGKTWVAALVAGALRDAGRSVAARKPAQSFEPTDPEDGTDAAQLAAATGEDRERVCPRARWYPIAMAPPMAADALGRRRVHLAELVGEVDGSWGDRPADVGLVELAGGVWSPIAHDGDGLDMTRALHPDAIVLVADAGLGTINAVRPAEAALGAVAPVTVLLNRFDPGDDLHVRNRAWLDEAIPSSVVVGIDDLVDTLDRTAERQEPPR